MVELDPEATVAGALERVLLAETASPSALIYDPGESLKAMRFMRQVIENRLKFGHAYGAPRGAKSEIEVISVGAQFEGFGSYPKLPPNISKNIRESLAIANAKHDHRSAEYIVFVNNAVLAATEVSPPVDARIPANVVAWKTKDAASPGPKYVFAGSAQGNDFYAVLTPPGTTRPKR